jgi:hypothetical protein
MKNLIANLTGLEKKVFNAFISLLDGKIGYSDVVAADIWLVTSLHILDVRSAILSLEERGIIFKTKLTDQDVSDFVYINLSKEYWGLNPKWAAEKK